MAKNQTLFWKRKKPSKFVRKCSIPCMIPPFADALNTFISIALGKKKKTMHIVAWVMLLSTVSEQTNKYANNQNEKNNPYKIAKPLRIFYAHSLPPVFICCCMNYPWRQSGWDRTVWITSNPKPYDLPFLSDKEFSPVEARIDDGEGAISLKWFTVRIRFYQISWLPYNINLIAKIPARCRE